MPTFKLTVEMNNAAFQPEGEGNKQIAERAELARILAGLSNRVQGMSDGGTVRDVNGNAVGTWKVTR